MKLVRQLVFLAAAVLAACAIAVQDDGFDAHVDRILEEMAIEDDAYGIDELGNAPNAQEALKHSTFLTELKTFQDIETFINVRIDPCSMFNFHCVHIAVTFHRKWTTHQSCWAISTSRRPWTSSRSLTR